MDLTAAALPTTRRGHEYILVLKDALTRYVEVFPIKDKKPLTIAQIIVDHIFCRYGAISTLVSDQGTEFVNSVIKQLTALLRTQRILTTPYSPRSNGLVEAQNRTLKDNLAVYTNSFQDDWDVYLNLVMFQYNTTVCAQTGYSPYFMLYGREASQPHNQWIEQQVQEMGVENLDKYVFDLAKHLTFVWDMMATKKVKDHEVHNRPALKPRVFKEYNPGDLFFIKNVPDATYTHWDNPKDKRPISAKLQHRWAGPYRVIDKINPVIYTASINGRVKRIHALAMKPMRSDFGYFTPAVDPPSEVVVENPDRPQQQFIPGSDPGGHSIMSRKAGIRGP
jgi:hypothetical protein